MMEKKNNKVLFIDYMLLRGHVNFNRIHINALLNEGYDVKLVLHRDIVEQLNYPSKQYALVIPRRFGIDINNRLLNRLLLLFTLLYIKLRINFKLYDNIIVSSMDELTLGILPLCRKMLIICHGNAQGLKNGLKRFFIFRLAKYNFFAVFNESMAGPFKEYGIKRLYIISHGCIVPFQYKQDIPSVVPSASFKRVIFHPSPNINQQFVKKVLNSDRLQRLLQEENCLLVLRNKYGSAMTRGNIQCINQYLSMNEYQNLFLTADIILVVYPPDFCYRVSGVSFECIANQKKLLALYNPSLLYCNQYFSYSPIFNDIDELCEKIEYLFTNPYARCIVSDENLIPCYTPILSQIKAY